MSDYQFSDHERYAVFTVHGEKCYMCNRPLDIASMEIDHVIPEHLLQDSTRRTNALQQLGRPATFQINSYENWLPSCHPCNNSKRGRVFEPSLLVQLALEDAAKKAPEARALAATTVTRNAFTRALNTIKRAYQDGILRADDLAELRPLLQFHHDARPAALANDPIRLTPLFEVLSECDGIIVVRGPYGVGAEPAGNPDPSFRCSSCGGMAFQGARCVLCGTMDDD